MSEPITHLTIMNRALARIGAGEIMAEDEDSELAAKVTAIYYDRLDAILAMTGWHFAEKTYRLDKLAETADNGYDAAEGKFITGWRYGFALPGTRLSLPQRVMTDPRRPDSPLRDYFIQQDVLYADRDPVWAAFTVRPDPLVWPPAFRLAATVAIAADLAVPVTHDKDLADRLDKDFAGTAQEGGRGGLIGKALVQDAAGARSKPPLWNDPLTDARLR